MGGMGRSTAYAQVAGGGSGGAIKLMTNSISGNGALYARGSLGNSGQFSAGGDGRIRIEAYTNNYGNISYPSYAYGMPSSVFLANVPSLSITSIAGAYVPSNPTASYSTPDIALPITTTNPVTVALSASYIPLTATVTVTTIPQYGSASNVTTTLSGSDISSTSTASVNLSPDYATVITAHTTYTLQTAMFWEGEKIDKVHVAAATGKGSKTSYITESGKEIPAEIMFAELMK